MIRFHCFDFDTAILQEVRLTVISEIAYMHTDRKYYFLNRLQEVTI